GLNHVSGLHVYNALPCFAAIIGAGAVVANRLARPFILRVACWVIVAVFMSGQVIAIGSKIAMMDANGRAAATLMPEAIEQVRALPPGGTLWLVRSSDADLGYSVFRVMGVDVLKYGEDFMRDRAGRPDAHVEFVDDDAPRRARRDRWRTAEGGHLVPVTHR